MLYNVCVCVFHSERTENGQTSVLNKGVANGKSFRFFFIYKVMISS